MIREVSGDILDTECSAIVNPVNLDGVMGAGLARQLSRQYPRLLEHYAGRCNTGELHIGTVFTFYAEDPHPRYIICLPTKQHWRNPSQLSYIEAGLAALKEEVMSMLLCSVAIPALGCGLGGLSWTDVRPLVVATADTMPNVDVELYPPQEGR